MTTSAIEAVRPALGRERAVAGPASTRTVVAYGFWLFILSDMALFAALFAAYAVLSGSTAGGPTHVQVINIRHVFIETMCLLVSSYACGLGALSVERRRLDGFLGYAALTFVLGAGFLFIEVSDFVGMARIGATPSRSAFLSAFWVLVGTHGAHVTGGLVWLMYMVAQVLAKGLRPHVLRRLLCFSLFWHALDIVWVGVLTVVYLIGAR
jgi:cytochrome o ubiquinol oxidase subunit III